MKWNREATLFLLILALVAAASVVEPRFVTLRSQTLLATHLWELAIIAVPMLLIIVTGGIDLSVGSMIALSAVATGLLYEKGVPPYAAAAIGILVGGLQGALNGWFVAKMKVHPLLVTLASLAAFRGIAEGISLARPISGYPDSFLFIGQGWIPPLTFLVLLLAAWMTLSKTIWGRWIIAIGTEERVSRFSLIPVDRVKLALYTLSGLACGVAAAILVARSNTAKADMGMGMELEAITAVVLGGASIEGGKGRVSGLLLGLVLIHLTKEFVSWHWKQNELNLIVIGALLIGAVLLERAFESRRKTVRTEVESSA